MAFRLKLFSKGCAFACIGRTLSGIQEVRGSIPLISTRKKYLQKSKCLDAVQPFQELLIIKVEVNV